MDLVLNDLNSPNVDEEPDSDTGLPIRHRAVFETTRRLLAQLINERLVRVTNIRTYGHKGFEDLVYLKPKYSSDEEDICLKLLILNNTNFKSRNGEMTAMVRPDSILFPAEFQINNTLVHVWDPVDVLEQMSTWFSFLDNAPGFERLKLEVRSAADNQEEWLKMSKDRELKSLMSSMLEWEQSIIYGHSTHPLHRTCRSLPPLKEVTPASIRAMQNPTLAVIAVPRSHVNMVGDYQRLLQPLLEKLDIGQAEPGKIHTLCLEQQLPIIESHFPGVTLIKTIEGHANAQASLQTFTLDPWLQFPFNLKLSLACQIKSSMSTVAPRAACESPFISDILARILHQSFWVFKEVASLTGNKNNHDIAQHISCTLQEDLEPRAMANGELLAPAAALQEKVPGFGVTNAQKFLGLKTVGQRMQWFHRYIKLLFNVALPPAVQHGVGLELYPQNIVVRINVKTKELTGFCIRDFSGCRLHRQTLTENGMPPHWEFPESEAVTDNLERVWDLVDRSLIQSHVAGLLYSLGIDSDSGWELVEKQLFETLRAIHHPRSELMYRHLTNDTTKLKCFLTERLKGFDRSNIEINAPNYLYNVANNKKKRPQSAFHGGLEDTKLRRYNN